MGNHEEFNEFVNTIAALRAPGGCPWDQEQTHSSIASNMLEEAYEAVDAIEHNDVAHMREELGDVLLQVVLQSQIAADEGEFDIDDVCRDINAKIVRRHPHVFGDAKGGTANEVIALWDKIKLQEREAAANAATAAEDAAGEGLGAAANAVNAATSGAASASAPKGLLDGVPVSFPALMQAQKISRKAVAVGFEWDSLSDVWDKVEEERGEFASAYAQAPKDERGVLIHGTPEFADAEMEFGDLLFTLVNVARKSGIDAERALRESCRKFRGRWASMEESARSCDCAMEGLDRAELESLWEQAKATAPHD